MLILATSGSLLQWLNAVHKEPQNQWWQQPWPDSGHYRKKYMCELCEFKATLKKDLTWHIQNKYKCVRYYCHQSEYIASQEGDLTRHIQIQYEGLRHLCDKCDQCEYIVSWRDDLTRHIQSPCEELRHYCDKCEYDFSDPSNLFQHIQLKYGVSYDCNLCVIIKGEERMHSLII